MRKVFALVVAASSFAATSEAAIMLEASPSPLDQGLVSWTLRAVSTADEIIVGVNNPSVTAPASGAGLHQVWQPFLGATPTRGDQGVVFFYDPWRAYDSYWFFTSTNSLSVGGPFTETNSGTGGATLPMGPAGAATTGFGTMGYTGASASKGFTIASGLQGTSVPLAQLVLKNGERANVSVGVLDNSGGYTRITGFVMDPVPNTPPIATDADLGFVQAAIINHLFTAADDDAGGLTWSNLTLTSPVAPAVPPTLSPSGQFTWHTITSQNDTRYTWMATVTDSGNPALSDTATLTLHLLIIPEPATIALVALAIVACMMRPTR